MDIEGLKRAVEKLIEWTPEGVDLRAISKVNYPPKHFPKKEYGEMCTEEDCKSPFFSEAYLYNLIGKDDTRTLLVLIKPLLSLAQQVIDGTIVECPCIKCSMDVKAKRNWACKACAISCPKDKLPSQKMMSEEIDIEDICEKVHKAYCKYHLEHKGEEYWTKGDYSKLTEEGKEYDRRTVRAVLEAIGIGTFQEEGGQI